MMLKRLHPIAGIIATLMILSFWVSTVVAELFGSLATVSAVKQAIPWGFFILIPALALTGATGFQLAAHSSKPEIARKKRRMPFIAANGLFILVPSALYLSMCAAHGAFGRAFYAVQAVELIAGAANLALMALNIRDGLRLSGRLT
ncbi:MAG: hypothetical protein WCF20_10330 [Methylovirgula sp.]